MTVGLLISAIALFDSAGMLPPRVRSGLLTCGGMIICAVFVAAWTLRSKRKRRPKIRVEVEEAPRDKLAKLRADIAKLREEERTLEEELLEEENRNASGPQRLKQGIPTDD
jgi:cell division protein FtsB